MLFSDILSSFLHSRRSKQSHVAACFFITLKTEAIYTRALTELKDINPCLSPAVLTTDFESATINAFRKVFPGIQPKGSFLHFPQANWRKLQEHGLSTMYQKVSSFWYNQKNCEMLIFFGPDSTL